MLFWMCGGMSLPLAVVEDVADEPPFFLRRIMRGAGLVVVGAEAADDGLASVMVIVCRFV